VDISLFVTCLILRFPAKEFTRLQVQEIFLDPERGSRNFFQKRVEIPVNTVSYPSKF